MKQILRYWHIEWYYFIIPRISDWHFVLLLYCNFIVLKYKTIILYLYIFTISTFFFWKFFKDFAKKTHAGYFFCMIYYFKKQIIKPVLLTVKLTVNLLCVVCPLLFQISSILTANLSQFTSKFHDSDNKLLYMCCQINYSYYLVLAK